MQMGHSHHIEIYKKFEKKACSNRYCIPVKYLVPIAEKYPELKEQFELARTDLEQMKKGLQEGLISQWCRIVNEVRTLIEEDLTSGEKVWFVYDRYTLDIKN